MIAASIIFSAVGGYILGSIPFGLVITKLAGLGDIRKIGSGNIGATNVLRTGRKGLAATTLILDSGKSAAAALIAMYFVSPDIAVISSLIAGTSGVLGHNFPVWLKFKGGKGVAATIGLMLATAYPVGLLVCATWLIVATIFRYSSLAALTALSLSPLYAYYFAEPAHSIAYGLLALLSIVRHRANIKRLVKGEETKIGKKKKSD